MSGRRKSRTPTTDYEQSVLIAHIQKFFAAPDRSVARADIVREVRSLLNVQNREWTSRTIRLWFNNNRKHYLEGRQNAPRQILPPIPTPDAKEFPPQALRCGYPPLSTPPPPVPRCWPVGVPMLPNSPPPQEQRNDGEEQTETTQMDPRTLPLIKRPPK
jgi:hypothetical protein